MTASAAVLWNKKQNARDVKQIQNVEGPTPAGSPQPWVYRADRELESVPHQSLFQAINVHYGERPDLKSMLALTRIIMIWCLFYDYNFLIKI